MNKYIKQIAVGGFALNLFLSVQLGAEEGSQGEAAEPAVTKEMKPRWETAIKEKYKWTDEQMATLKDSGLRAPQMAKVSQLALKSGKPLDQVLKMRTEQKMGWGKMAKELGVHPSELGQSVSSLRHGMKHGHGKNKHHKDHHHKHKHHKAMKNMANI